MSVTINYATEARIPFEYEDELEGEICVGNLLEMGPITHGPLNMALKALGVDHDFNSEVGEKIEPMAIIKALQRWDGKPVDCMWGPETQARRFTKIGMIAIACHLKGIKFCYA